MQLTPESLQSPGRDLTGWTVLKHIYACVPPYSATPSVSFLSVTGSH